MKLLLWFFHLNGISNRLVAYMVIRRKMYGCMDFLRIFTYMFQNINLTILRPYSRFKVASKHPDGGPDALSSW